MNWRLKRRLKKEIHTLSPCGQFVLLKGSLVLCSANRTLLRDVGQGCFSPDGQYFASGVGNSISIWRLNDLLEVHLIPFVDSSTVQYALCTFETAWNILCVCSRGLISFEFDDEGHTVATDLFKCQYGQPYVHNSSIFIGSEVFHRDGTFIADHVLGLPVSSKVVLCEKSLFTLDGNMVGTLSATPHLLISILVNFRSHRAEVAQKYVKQFLPGLQCSEKGIVIDTIEFDHRLIPLLLAPEKRFGFAVDQVPPAVSGPYWRCSSLLSTLWEAHEGLVHAYELLYAREDLLPASLAVRCSLSAVPGLNAAVPASLISELREFDKEISLPDECSTVLALVSRTKKAVLRPLFEEFLHIKALERCPSESVARRLAQRFGSCSRGTQLCPRLLHAAWSVKVDSSRSCIASDLQKLSLSVVSPFGEYVAYHSSVCSVASGKELVQCASAAFSPCGEFVAGRDSSSSSCLAIWRIGNWETPIALFSNALYALSVYSSDGTLFSVVYMDSEYKLVRVDAELVVLCSVSHHRPFIVGDRILVGEFAHSFSGERLSPVHKCIPITSEICLDANRPVLYSYDGVEIAALRIKSLVFFFFVLAYSPHLQSAVLRDLASIMLPEGWREDEQVVRIVDELLYEQC